jgi:sortase (surface protein transpeptidase)
VIASLPFRPRAVVLGLVAALFVLPACGTTRSTDVAPAPAAQPTSTGSAALSSYESTRTYPATAPPTRVRIPSIGVDSSLQELGRAPDQTIEVPADPGTAGWWSGGPRPGSTGPAVLVGHVDSRTGPAVFFRLGELQPGDEVFVDRADATTARFVVSSLGRYEKALFPSDLVYYPTLEPEIRLVTCGGPFDPSTGHYRDNLVVFADGAP